MEHCFVLQTRQYCPDLFNVLGHLAMAINSTTYLFLHRHTESSTRQFQSINRLATCLPITACTAYL